MLIFDGYGAFSISVCSYFSYAYLALNNWKHQDKIPKIEGMSW